MKKIKRLVLVFSLFVAGVFLLASCSKYSNISGKYNYPNSTRHEYVVIDDKAETIAFGNEYGEDKPLKYERLSENLIRIIEKKAGMLEYYYVCEKEIFPISGDTFYTPYEKE